MQYISHYDSPLGSMLMAGDADGLTGLWFSGQKYYGEGLDPVHTQGSLSVFTDTARWLDIYFSGRQPDFTPHIHLRGTKFRLAVWNALMRIPYGSTASYGDIAGEIAAEFCLSHMSAQAVGGAVGHNRISIIIPCHRVIGSDRSLTGYAGGLDKKAALLELEGGYTAQK